MLCIVKYKKILNIEKTKYLYLKVIIRDYRAIKSLINWNCTDSPHINSLQFIVQ